LGDRIYASKNGISHCHDVNEDEVLAVYRYRWQVELYFKRRKSLLRTGEVPKKRAECMEA